MDLFGGVPIVTDAEVAARARDTRAATFAFIEKELTEARNDLPVTWPATDYGRATKGWADAMLASLYLNAEVFTGTVTASGLQKGQPQWQKAIDAADRVLSNTSYRAHGRSGGELPGRQQHVARDRHGVRAAAGGGAEPELHQQQPALQPVRSRRPTTAGRSSRRPYRKFDPDGQAARGDPRRTAIQHRHRRASERPGRRTAQLHDRHPRHHAGHRRQWHAHVQVAVRPGPHRHQPWQ